MPLEGGVSPDNAAPAGSRGSAARTGRTGQTGRTGRTGSAGHRGAHPNARAVSHTSVLLPDAPHVNPAAAISVSCRRNHGPFGPMIFGQQRRVCGATAASPGWPSPVRTAGSAVGPGLQLVQLGVQAAGPDQRGVVPAGHDPALFRNRAPDRKTYERSQMRAILRGGRRLVLRWEVEVASRPRCGS